MCVCVRACMRACVHACVCAGDMMVHGLVGAYVSGLLLV